MAISNHERVGKALDALLDAVPDGPTGQRLEVGHRVSLVNRLYLPGEGIAFRFMPRMQVASASGSREGEATGRSPK